jgi:hypothetical protein
LQANGSGKPNRAELEKSSSSTVVAFGSNNSLSSESGDGNHLLVCDTNCGFGSSNKLSSDKGGGNFMEVETFDFLPTFVRTSNTLTNLACNAL